ncbi:hypothetical protein D3C73_1478110 [compost metagenome]
MYTKSSKIYDIPILDSFLQGMVSICYKSPIVPRIELATDVDVKKKQDSEELIARVKVLMRQDGASPIDKISDTAEDIIKIKGLNSGINVI